jgi:LysM repeat protein
MKGREKMPKARRIISLIVAVATILVGLGMPYAGSNVALADGVTVALVPSAASVPVGSTVTLDIQIQNVTGLYGAEVRLSFDPTRLQVQDALAYQTGVQIQPGTFPNPADGFVAVNSADNASGTIIYAMTLLAPAAPVSGSGVFARVVFQGVAGGSASVIFTSVSLLNNLTQPIPAATQNATITVTGGPTATTAPPTATPTRTPGPTVTPGPTATRTPTATPGPAPVCSVYYTVRWGDTLYSIARRFGTTVQAIAAVNGITNPSLIRIGQVLCIPGGTVPPPPPPPPPPTDCWYVVKAGDTLYRIALQYNTTIWYLASINGIPTSCFNIYVGQRLRVPCTVTPPPTGQCYVVQRGDTLYSLAIRWGTTVYAIMVKNSLANPNYIYVGQVLCRP